MYYHLANNSNLHVCSDTGKNGNVSLLALEIFVMTQSKFNHLTFLHLLFFYFHSPPLKPLLLRKERERECVL